MAQNSIARLAIQIITDTRPMAAGFSAARSQVVNFAGSIGQATSGASAMAGAVASLGPALGVAGIAGAAALAAAGLAKFAKTGLSVAANMEQVRISFEVLTGSAKTAGELIGDLRALSAETPLEFSEVNTAAKTLLAMGEDTRSVISSIKMLGDVSSATGQPLNELAQVFGQVMQAGRLTGNELRQFNERGVPILTTLAAKLGVSKQAIRDLVEAGQISSAQVVEAFESMTGAGGKFANMMARQADTLIGQWNKFKENLSILAGEVMKPIADMLKSILMSMNELLDVSLRWAGIERARAATTADKDAVKRLREQEAALRDTEKAAEASAKSEKSRMEDLKRSGESMAKSLRTPFEIFQDTIKELHTLTDSGVLSAEMMERGISKAAAAYMKTEESVKSLKNEIKGIPAIEAGTAGFHSAVDSFRRDSATVAIKGDKEHTALLKRIASATEAELGKPAAVFKKGTL